ncbi:hypothetical protein [Salinarimonas soli]|uniref:Uncharacterized protein n=1 Tax=Salinarimonas soli TaxID=1638099 RepID=A0A5B2VAZ5_9HYPH|nr:hypothetical protein [Salinarimonas soli]KAA2235562.1 hypothetical protein F0L46_18840 [Salinarimonas soli]
MITGQRLLSTYPGAKVRIACKTCGASWQFDKAALLDRFGDVGLASLHTELARGKGCIKGRSFELYDLCGAYYVDLWTSPAEA